MRWRKMMAVAGASALLAVACGDDSDNDGDDADPGDGAAEEAPVAGPTDDPRSGPGGGLCGPLIAFVQEYDQQLMAANEGSEISTDQLASLGAQARAEAPAEVSPAVDLLTEGIEDFLGGGSTETFDDPEAYDAAADQLNDYSVENCDFDIDAYFDEP